MEKSLIIGICDDDAMAIAAITGYLEKFFSDKGIKAELKKFNSAKELLKDIGNTHYSLFLLDIDMGKEDGIELANRIRDSKCSADIIFVSNREDRVFESFPVDPLGFVRKSRFFDDMNKYLNIFLEHDDKKNKTVVFKSEGEIVNILLSDIVYIEGALAVQHIYVKNKKDYYTVRSSMRELEIEMQPYGFMRIHSGFLVNVSYVSVIRRSDVVLKNGGVLPLARSKAKEIRELFLKIMRTNGEVTF